MPLRLFCFTILFCLVHADPQLVVSVGQRVEGVTTEGRSWTARSLEGRALEGTGASLAADALTGRVVAAPGVSEPHGGPLISLGPSAGPLVAPGPLTASTRVAALAVDPVARHVYWTTGQNRTILRAPIDPPSQGSSPHQPQLVIKFTVEIPHGIAIDPCSGTIFWSNRALDTATVERASLPEAGSSPSEVGSRGVVASSDLFQPLGLAYAAGWLYWADERSGSRFRLERARPDGSGRSLLVDGNHQQPFALVATSAALYWTDVQQGAMWSLPLDKGADAQPVLLRRFPSTPTGLAATSLTPEELSCPRVAPIAQQLLAGGDAKSECPADFCLNGGVCTARRGSDRSCSCPPGFLGLRCQYENKMCASYCLDRASTIANSLYTICGCSKYSIAIPEEPVIDREEESNEFLWRTIALCLAGVTTIAVFAVIFLAVVSWRLSRRPRLRRRYTVTKKKPPGLGGTAAVSNSQCEIDIENCCNMNICETPCFEPELRKGDCSTFSRDEKRGLIGSEEPTANCLPPSASVCPDF